MSTQTEEVEATASVVQTADGRWCIRFAFDDGRIVGSDKSFETQQQAEAALSALVDYTGMRRIATAQ